MEILRSRLLRSRTLRLPVARSKRLRGHKRPGTILRQELAAGDSTDRRLEHPLRDDAEVQAVVSLIDLLPLLPTECAAVETGCGSSAAGGLRPARSDGWGRVRTTRSRTGPAAG